MINFVKNVLRRREGTQEFFAPPGSCPGGNRVFRGGALPLPPVYPPLFVLYLFLVLTMILGYNITIGKRAELFYDLLFPPCLSIKSYMERAREEEREKE